MKESVSTAQCRRAGPFFATHAELCAYLRRRAIYCNMRRLFREPLRILKRRPAAGPDYDWQARFTAYAAWPEDVRSRLAALPAGFVTDFSLHPESAHILFSLVREREYSTVVECGCGISTIMLALATEGRDATVISLEHDPEWLSLTKHALATLRLHDRVSLRHAPLCNVPFDDTPCYGYPPAALTGVEPQLLFIDAPPQTIGRKGVLPAVAKYLKRGTTILLDDARRDSERECVESWCRHGVARLKGYCGLGQGIAVLESC